MRHYNPNEPGQVALVATWYQRMRECGDLELAFHQSARSWIRFVNQWSTQRSLRYEIKDGEIIAAVWLTPWCDGVSFGQWVDRSHGQSKLVAAAILAEFNEALRLYPVVLAFTIQSRLERMYTRIGMTKVGTIPAMWEGKPVLVYAKEGV